MFNWAFVIADVNEPILGLDFLRAQELNINPITNQLFKGKTIINCESKSGSPKCYRVEITDPVLRLIEERPTLTDPTNKAVKHNIVHFINTNDEPIKVPNHHYNPKIQNIIKDTFDEYLKLGYVCYSSSEWSSPLAIVPKKGGQYRVCGDYRFLNRKSLGDNYVLPYLPSFNNNMANCKYFSNQVLLISSTFDNSLNSLISLSVSFSSIVRFGPAISLGLKFVTAYNRQRSIVFEVVLLCNHMEIRKI